MYSPHITFVLSLLLLAACGVGLRLDTSSSNPAAIITPSKLVYVVSNTDQSLVLAQSKTDGSFSALASMSNWTFGSTAIFLPTGTEPTHAFFYTGFGTTLSLFKLRANGLPQETPLAQVSSDGAASYYAVVPSLTGTLIGVQGNFGNAERTDTIAYDLAAGTLTKLNQFVGGRTTPQNGVVWNNTFFYLLDHFSHGIGVSTFNPDKTLKSTEESFYSICSGTPSLCPGGFPAGQLALHPTLPLLYAVSYYHAQGAVLNINTTTGALTQAQVYSTQNKPWGELVHPSGKWLFVGHMYQAGFSTYLQSFSLNTTTGAVTPTAISNLDLGFSMSSIAIDKTGNFLVVTDAVNQLHTIAVDQTTGALTDTTQTNLGVANPNLPNYFILTL